MPRSSRHKSHRERKRDARSDSEEEGNSRERRPRSEESPAARVSRDPEPEKKNSSGNDATVASNSDEHGKKRKDMAEDTVSADRWNGGEGGDRSAEKRSKVDEFRPAVGEKTGRTKLSASDSKGKSSRKHESSGEKNEDRGCKVEPGKQRLEKDSKSGGGQYKETKERDRGSDKKGQYANHEKPDDGGSRKERLKRDDGERKKDEESAEWKIQDELCNPGLEKELEKRIRKRRDSSGDKGLGDSKDSSDKRFSSKDDRTKSGSYNDERPKDGASRDKHPDDLDKDQRHWDDRSSRDDRDRRDRDERLLWDDRDQRHRDDHMSRDERDQRHRDDHMFRDERDQRHRNEKHRDDRMSRDHTSDRSDSKHFREEKKPSEGCYKKSKYYDNDHDSGSYVDDRTTKYKDTHGRKRFSDENDDPSDLKLRSAKEPPEDVEKIVSTSTKFDPYADRARLEYLHADKVDPSLNNYRQRSSPSSSAHVKDRSRRSSKQAEPAHTGSPSEERLRYSTTATGDYACMSGVHERASQPQSLVKTKSKDGIHSSELLIETAASSQCDRPSRSDSYTSPNQSTEKSPSTSDRQLSDKIAARCSLDIEEAGHKTSFKAVRDYSSVEEPSEKPFMDDRSEAELFKNGASFVGSSSITRPSHFSSNSPNHLPPPPPVRLGIDSPSVLGSYEDDSRVQNLDRKSSGRYKRPTDFGMGRGQGNAWKGTPTWPSPITNGFIPFQHGPHAGFHPNVQQFPAPPVFGVRPSMDLNHPGIPFHLHEMADRFSGHGRPFGWQNPVDDSCPPHFQVWDGNSGMFGGESHVYEKPEWDQSRHVTGNRGWEMNPDMWRGQNRNFNTDLPVPHREPEHPSHALVDEARGGQSGYQAHNEQARPECLQSESMIKRPSDTPPAKNAIERSPKSLNEKKPVLVKTTSAPEPTSIDDNTRLCCAYLSKLDISLDLAHSELYKQCMSLLGTRDATDASNVLNHKYHQVNKEETAVLADSSNCIINFLFPMPTDAVFQRAISLYKKQSEGRKPKSPISLIVGSNVKKSLSEASDEERVEAHTYSGDALLTNANPSSDIEEGSNTATDMEGNLLGDAKGKNSDLISAVFVEGSESFEALIPECRVNLSQIPNSPESTH